MEQIVREYQIAPGKIIPMVEEERGMPPLKADYVLQLKKNFKIAVVEARHTTGPMTRECSRP